jgi:hypothetical protein
MAPCPTRVGRRFLAHPGRGVLSGNVAGVFLALPKGYIDVGCAGRKRPEGDEV